MTRGERLATLFSLLFHHNCGAFGDDDPILEGNELTLYSQMGEQTYIFNNNGSVDVVMCDDYTDAHYKTVKDLLHSDDGWFAYIDPSLSLDKILKEYFS